MSEKLLLLVEDSRDDADLVERALRGTDFSPRVVVARDGVAALDFLCEQVRKESALPDVVFLDLKLPKLSGFDVLRRVRADAHTRGLPIVILTSSREERDIVCCYQLGANSYVRKPIVSEHFTDAIRLAGAYWLRLNERLPAPAARGTNGATVAR